MKFLQTLHTDLRERQILPAVVVLAVLAVAIPIFASYALSSVSTPAQPSIAPQPVALPKGVAAPGRELVLLTTPPAVHAITRSGAEPNPFREAGATAGATQSPTPANPSTPSSTPATKTTPASTTPAKTTPAKTTPAKTTPAKTTPAKTSPAKTAPSKKPASKPKSTPPKQSTKPNSGSAGKPAPLATATPTTGPATLKSTQAYTVNIDTKDANGTHALSDVVRLAPLPAAQTPELIYLGVLTGGKKAAFLFTNAVKVSGPSSSGLTCLPSAQDCQIVELSPGQGMSLAPTSNTALIATFTFELMSIAAKDFSSASAAMEARDAVSTAGQTLLPLYSSPELQTLRFDDKTGALVHHSVPAAGSTGSSGSTGSTGSSGSAGTTNAVRFPAP
ncbi:MAG TPA: hypothetical protein VN740_04195 [Solirubrobacteraceae bacterium]|nr:hypothetical protein [Solirubrobacteraceae bacterium]